MNGRIPYIVDAGICTIGVESTVVEVRDDGLTILRPRWYHKRNVRTSCR